MSRPPEPIWAPRAIRDLREIWTYYAAHASTDVADAVIRRILKAAARVQEHPLSGRPRDEIKIGLRSTLSDPHVMFYRPRSSGVEIVRVLHQRRDLPAVWTARPPKP